MPPKKVPVVYLLRTTKMLDGASAKEFIVVLSLVSFSIWRVWRLAVWDTGFHTCWITPHVRLLSSKPPSSR